MKDNVINSCEVNIDSAHPPKLKKKRTVGGTVMGIINIVLSAPAGILLVAVITAMILGGLIITMESFEISTGAADNWLEIIILGFFDVLFKILLMSFVIVVCFFTVILGSVGVVVTSVPSFIFFIVARFNRSKFFKVSSVIVSLITAAESVLAVALCTTLVLVSQYGMSPQV